MVRRLNAIPGMKSRPIEGDAYERGGASYLSSPVLGRPDAMAEFLATLDWLRSSLKEQVE